jgi:hypothetical protein
MAREPLKYSEIKELVRLVRGVFSDVRQLKAREPLARHIQYPKVPSILSESLALHLLKRRRLIPGLHGHVFGFGGKTADILGKSSTGREKRIEVKATGTNAFQNFVKKDTTADYIIWFHFDDYFLRDDNPPIAAFLIRKPGRFFRERVYVNLSSLKAKVPDLEEKKVDVL